MPKSLQNLECSRCGLEKDNTAGDWFKFFYCPSCRMNLLFRALDYFK